jgi:peptidoglycan/LPS O-acetylase OafA/YrhL
MELSFLWGVPNLPAANLCALGFYAILAGCLHPAFRERVLTAMSHPVPTTHTVFSSLDSLRGFAAMWVFLGHTFTRTHPILYGEPTFMRYFMSTGQKAVPIFCVLTGFLIFRSAQKLDSWPRFSGYARNRVYRILPLYVFAILLAALMLLIGLPNVTGASWSYFLFEIVPTQGIIEASQYNMILGHLWSLYVEVEFYVLAPFIVLLTGRIAKAGPFALLASLVVATIYFIFVKEFGGRETQLWLYFMFGILASVLVDQFGKRIPPIAGTALVLIGIVMLMADIRGYDWGSTLSGRSWGNAGNTVGLGVATVLIVIGVVTDRLVNKLLSFQPLRIVGIISYSLFVLHPFYLYANFYPVGLAAQNLVPVTFTKTGPMMPSAYFYLVFIPGMIFVSMLGYAFVERVFLARRSMPGPHEEKFQRTI